MSSESQVTNITMQYEALREFYLSTRMYSESSMLLHNWVFDSDTIHVSYCNFTGVTCDDNNMVTHIELNSTQLAGSLPDNIGVFSKLRRLRLFNNSIQGTIPDSLLHISTLKLLNLGQNRISGTLPEFTSTSLYLSRLSLNKNAISGTIPASICRHTNLVVFEISQLTRMHGSIPDCFSALTALASLRVADIGLTGTVPIDLCNERVMNGLSPNTFGCDAIACPVGTFQRAVGRQFSDVTPCIPCNVPSNVIGTTTCQWHEINVPSLPPSTEGSTAGPKPSYSANSYMPSEAPVRWNSQSPTSTTTYSPSFIPPSSEPGTQYISMEPSFAEDITTSAPNIPVQIDLPSRNGIAVSPGIATGIALLCIALIILLVLAINWRRRPLLPHHKRFTDETSSDNASNMKDSSEDDDSFVNYATELKFEDPKEETKEFDVTDDVSFSSNDIYFTRYDSIQRGEFDMLSSTTPMKQIRAKDTSLQLPNQEVQCTTHSPYQKHEDSSSARKVRFTIPEPISITEVHTSTANDFLSTNDSAPVTRDAWLSWLLNPIFDPIASCGTPCRDISKSDLDISSAISLDSKYSNLSDLFAAHGAASAFHRKFDISYETYPPPEISSIIGIRDIRTMNDDSSINSPDGSDKANIGTMFRPKSESPRRDDSPCEVIYNRRVVSSNKGQEV
jgi:hypothetical protein